MSSTLKNNSIQPSVANETGDVSQINMQSTEILDDAGKMEVDYGGDVVVVEKGEDENDGGSDKDEKQLEMEENLEVKKDFSGETSEMETNSRKDDEIENDNMELPSKEIKITGEISNNNNPGLEISVPVNVGTDSATTVTIDKKIYESLVAEQKRLTDELKRLKERLITVEDDYTTEILELEERESKTRNELNQALETIGQLKNCIKEVDQPSNWSERMEQLKIERDAALDDVSKLDDKVHRLTASVTNLQLVIEQIQKENENKVSSLTKQHLAALESERAKQNDLRQEVEMYEKKSMESAQALEAATRLTENIDKKEEIIQNLKQELSDKEKQISNLELDKGNLKASFEGKVDKQVIKNLILGYFGTPNDKKHEVERLLARVLDFNEQEMIRAGLSFGRPSNKFGLDAFASSGSSSLINPTSNSTAAGSILLAPLQSTSSTGNHHPSSSVAVSSGSSASSATSSYSNEPATGISGSLSKMFVEFLEAESRPKGVAINSHSTSSLTRELARDFTKVALNSNNRSHSILEPALTIGNTKVTPAPITPTSALSSSVLGAQTQPDKNDSLQDSQESRAVRSYMNRLVNTSIAPMATQATSNNLNTNPIRPITINNIPESDSSIKPMASMPTPHQHQKSASLSSISSSSSSSSLILSNTMPSYPNVIKPITFDANSHTHPAPQPLSSSSSSSTIISTTPLPQQPQPLIAQQSAIPPSSSHHLLSISENTSHLKPSHSSSSLITSYMPSSSSSSYFTPPTTNSISPVVSSPSLLLATPSSSDYNSLLSNSHLKVKK